MKNKSSVLNEHLARSLPGILKYHENMLADGIRNRILARSISDAVRPGSSFLDVGAGTGIWAVLAAKLGAKRVVAIESEEALIPLIHSTAVENSVSDRIEIIHGRSTDVKIRERFDVIVSELFGSDALGFSTIEAMMDVRDRFLKKDGIFLPQKLSLFAVPAHLKTQKLGLEGKHAISARSLADLKRNFASPIHINDRANLELLAEPTVLSEVDFLTVKEPPSKENLIAKWQMKRLDRVNAIVVFNRSMFGPRRVLDGLTSQSWGVTRYDLIPFAKRSGELYFRATFDRERATWTAGVSDSPECRPQTYGPVFAISRLQFGLSATPHRKVKPKKPS